MLILIEKRSSQLLFRAIGYEHDKDILDIFGLADEVKTTKSGLKKIIGKKLMLEFYEHG